MSHAPLPSKTIWTILTGTMIAMFLGALDQTIIAAALPTIGRELGDFDSISWVASLYLLATTAVTPLYGKISDIHGRRVTMLAAIAIFTIGSIACALAPTMLALIIARGVQGLGGGGLISLSQTIIADIVAPKERGKRLSARKPYGTNVGRFSHRTSSLVIYFLDQSPYRINRMGDDHEHAKAFTNPSSPTPA
jgi:MFS family permease